jgi:DNA-binding NtrC family response regulator
MNAAEKGVPVVEDEASQRLMYRKALSTFGFEVECAETGRAALALLARSRIGAVILDLHLGGERGMDVFASIRERHPAVSVVIATGHGSVEAMKRAIRLEVVDFLTKPVLLAELESAIARAWARHELVETAIDDLEDPAPHGPGRQADISDFVHRTNDLNLASIEQAAIREALRRCDNNRKLAAEMLGLSERTLYYRLSQCRLRRGATTGLPKQP